MIDIVQAFEERLQEIEIYLDLLKELEKQVQQGPPRIGSTGPTITAPQQKILYSSVYLQLYNLVESTVSVCLDAVTVAVATNGPWQPGDLSSELRSEWVRAIARTHEPGLGTDKRLAAALELCDHLVQQLPVPAFKVEKGAGGSWDDLKIQDITRRLGLALKINPQVNSNAKKHFRNELGSLVFIKTLRNELAHGSLSFVECGDGVTVSELEDLKERTAQYLREVVLSLKAFIDAYEFLLPERRPNTTGTGA